MKVLPQGAWFGLTRIRLRRISVAAALVILPLAVLYSGARTFLYFESRRARSFVEELEKIQIGQSQGFVLPLVNQYYVEHAWDEEPNKHGKIRVLRVDPWHFYRPFVRWQRLDNAIKRVLFENAGWRRAIGLRAWMVRGDLDFEAERVSFVSVNMIVEGENEWLMADWRYAAKVPPDLLKHRKDYGTFRPEMARLEMDWTHLHMGWETGEGIINHFTPLATAEETNAGRNINLNCLTSWRGCHSLCELMPDAARYRREHGYRSLGGWSSGSWGSQDHSCE